jgi:hypothetical protein
VAGLLCDEGDHRGLDHYLAGQPVSFLNGKASVGEFWWQRAQICRHLNVLVQAGRLMMAAGLAVLEALVQLVLAAWM